MRIKISNQMLTFVDLTKVQELHVEKVANHDVILHDVPQGLVAKGSKADLYDLICALAYHYDLEIE